MPRDLLETLSRKPIDLTSATGRIAHQHFKIQSTFDELEMTEDQLARVRLGRQLAEHLRAHAALEEEAFYPVVQRLGGDAAKWVQQACQIHRSIDSLVEEMSADFTREKVAVVRDAVTRHIEDEESQIFPLVEGLDEAPARELARSMEEHIHSAERDDGAAVDDSALEEPGSRRYRVAP